MSETVLVIDPGDRVGWCRATIEDDVIVADSIRQGVTPLKDFALALGRRFEADEPGSWDPGHPYDHVVYETWRLRPDMAKKMVGNDFQPIQLIGIIRFLCWQHPGVQLHSISPNVKTTGRKVMPDAIKERLALSSEEHDKDALDLLCAWWFKNYV